VIERARSLAEGGEIQLAHLPPELASAPAVARDDRKEELAALLAQHAGNVTHVAAALGIARSQLQRLLKKHGLDPARYRA
jgi:transcriptional regulator of acetoin/glycerol metabolism